MKDKQIKNILNAGLILLEHNLIIPSAIKEDGFSFSEEGLEQLCVNLKDCDVLNTKDLVRAIENLAYRLNYRNRFYKNGRIGIPRKKLAVKFANMELPYGFEGQVGNYHGVAMRVCCCYDIERDYSFIRFDVLVKFVNKKELRN